MRLIYGTTTLLVVTIADRFCGSEFHHMCFADEFNMDHQNPPSSNPFQIFLDYQAIVQSSDLKNPKFFTHREGVRRNIRKNLIIGTYEYASARETVKLMSTNGLKPYLAILEVDTYESRTGISIQPELPPEGGSLTSKEYRLHNIWGPNHASGNPDMHLQKLHS